MRSAKKILLTIAIVINSVFMVYSQQRSTEIIPASSLERKEEKEIIKEDIKIIKEDINQEIREEIEKERKREKEEKEKIKKLGYPENLKFFGYDFFALPPSTFAPISEVPVPSTYTLGPGDVLKLVFWTEIGQETAEILKVDYEGQIHLPFVGVLTVRGLTIEQFKEIVLSKLRTRFKNLQGYVVLDKLRTINVFVTGEAKSPGMYTISGLSGAFNALYVAGGPSFRGSMRKIKLIRNNKVIKEIDLYKYLLEGDKSQDCVLENGDTVFIPVAGPTVAIQGKVKREGIYELLGGEKLSDIVNLAGGILASGYLNRLQVERIKDNKKRIILDIDLSHVLDNKDTSINIDLQDGDVISVLEVLEPRFDIVEIRGQVNRPGVYELKPNMRISDLINIAEGTKIREEIYYDRAEIYRKNEDNTIKLIEFNLKKALEDDPKENILLQSDDVVRIYKVSEMKWQDRKITIEGAVQRPGVYMRPEGMTLKDAIFQAGGLLPEAYNIATVARQKGEETILIYSDLDKLLKGDDSQNILLEDLDKVSIRKLSNIKRTPDWVYIEGEVKMPGAYAILKNDTLYSLIKRSGGITEDGFVEGAIFTRDINYISTPEQRRTSEDIIKTQQSITERKYQAQLARYGASPPQQEKVATLGKGLLPPEGKKNIAQAELMQQAALEITEAGERIEGEKKEEDVITPPPEIPPALMINRIPINLKEIIQTEGKNGDVLLKPGDRIFIPKKPQTVTLLGAVVNQGSILFEKNKKINWYVERVGGYSLDADKKNIVVVKPSGEIVPKNKIKYVELGDIIIVPTKVLIIEDKTKWERIRETIKALSDVAMAAYIIDSLRK